MPRSAARCELAAWCVHAAWTAPYRGRIEAYQEAKKLREGAASFRAIAVQGVDKDAHRADHEVSETHRNAGDEEDVRRMAHNPEVAGFKTPAPLPGKTVPGASFPGPSPPTCDQTPGHILRPITASDR